jgi:Ca2+-binding RTX toxin-like protein
MRRDRTTAPAKENSMQWNLPQPATRARLMASLLMASAVGVLTVASANAQAQVGPLAQPAPASASGVPTTLSVLPGLPTAPGGTPTIGVPLDQVQAAAQALGAGTRSPTAAHGVTAVFMAPVGVLAVTGTAQNDTIVVSRDAAGTLLVNAGAVPIVGGTATVANTTLIEQFGLDGSDNLALDEANGALPKAILLGGAGNDTLTGGSGADQLFGEAGNDTLLGKNGVDLLFGGAGNDKLTGGTGDDQVFGGAGDDRIIWNPGEGTDLNEGGDGTDTVEVNGGNGAEVFSVVPNGTRVRFDRTSPAPFSLDIGTVENLTLNMNGGDDTFTGSNGLAPLLELTVDGGPGNDIIAGGDGDDRLLGGDGNDFLDGNRGNDTVRGGAGDDTFVWNPGDGSDTLEGQAGTDTLRFNGANIGERFDLSANGSRLRLSRDVANISLDVNAVERVNLVELGGADTTTINDLTGTGVTDISLDLAATPGGPGDSQVDTVVVNATGANDTVQISGVVGSVSVDGLATNVSVSGAEPTDGLVVNGLAGDDALAGAALTAGALSLTLDGGDGDDVLIGGAGNDTLLGGPGDDVLIGGPGQDILDGGTGSNILIQD